MIGNPYVMREVARHRIAELVATANKPRPTGPKPRKPRRKPAETG